MSLFSNRYRQIQTLPPPKDAPLKPVELLYSPGLVQFNFGVYSNKYDHRAKFVYWLHICIGLLLPIVLDDTYRNHFDYACIIFVPW